MQDMHVHTYFSTDSEADPFAYVKEAIQRGIKHLTFTDHTDLKYPHTENFDFDIAKYDAMMQALYDKFSGHIHLYKGIELGLQTNCILESALYVEDFKPDFVLCSIHVVDHADLYYGTLFENHTPLQAMRMYLETLLSIVKRFKTFNVLGHLDIPKRYHPAIDKVPLADYIDLIDAIFDTIIPRDQGIEINTSGLRTQRNQTMPSFDILDHYLTRGGKIMTIGSDSHTVDTVGRGYDLAAEYLRDKGIKEVYVFKNMVPRPITL